MKKRFQMSNFQSGLNRLKISYKKTDLLLKANTCPATSTSGSTLFSEYTKKTSITIMFSTLYPMKAILTSVKSMIHRRRNRIKPRSVSSARHQSKSSLKTTQPRGQRSRFQAKRLLLQKKERLRIPKQDWILRFHQFKRILV